MHFCKKCDNMLYLRVNSDNENTHLLYECLKCNNQEKNIDNNNCIFKIDYNIDDIKKDSFINEYMYDDITIPRAEGIKCPNKTCPKITGASKSKQSNILYIQYDKENMKYIYVCLDCRNANIEPHIW